MNEEKDRYRIIFYINIAFTVFFVLEAFIKIFAFTPPVSDQYWSWCFNKSSSMLLLNLNFRFISATFGMLLNFQLNSFQFWNWLLFIPLKTIVLRQTFFQLVYAFSLYSSYGIIMVTSSTLSSKWQWLPAPFEFYGSLDSSLK